MNSETITISRINGKSKKPLSLNIDLDKFTIEVSLDGLNSKIFNGHNMYDSFKKFNQWLQVEGWIPLCNGARIDAKISGMLADVSDGLSVYLLDEPMNDGFPLIVNIFGLAAEDKVGTIEQQQHYSVDSNENQLSSFNEQNISNATTVSTLERFRGCLIGLACGDAVGTAVEFKPRGSFPMVTGMNGGGPFNLRPGEWTDDTSMALCLASSLIDEHDGQMRGFDASDQIIKYLQWRNEGYMSSTGRCFDIGNTISRALDNFEKTGNPYSGPTEPRSAGNGSIMRLAPIPMFYLDNENDTARYAELSSKITHGAQEAIDACHLFSLMIRRALLGHAKSEIICNTKPLRPLADRIQKISNGEYMDKNIDNIIGNGYVVNSLEAALWCFYVTDNYSDAILTATNLGDDADTTAAICGQLSGAYYGITKIPKDWQYKLAKRTMISDLAKKLFENHH